MFQSALAPKDERYCGADALARRSSFNPLSPRRTRDTPKRWPGPFTVSSFNPLSPRRTRDTITPPSTSPVTTVSIRSRPEGREIPVWLGCKRLALPCFNPLSPRRTRDTCLVGLQAVGFAMFQSALAPKDERYSFYLWQFAGLNKVSIRSRPEGREIPLAPRRYFLQAMGFNPLSPRRTRDTPAMVSTSRPAFTFQPALAPKDERYTREHCLAYGGTGFNPLSPRRTRDTIRKLLSRHHKQCFNPLSPRRTRDTRGFYQP